MSSGNTYYDINNRHMRSSLFCNALDRIAVKTEIKPARILVAEARYAYDYNGPLEFEFLQAIGKFYNSTWERLSASWDEMPHMKSGFWKKCPNSTSYIGLLDDLMIRFDDERGNYPDELFEEAFAWFDRVNYGDPRLRYIGANSIIDDIDRGLGEGLFDRALCLPYQYWPERPELFKHVYENLNYVRDESFQWYNRHSINRIMEFYDETMKTHRRNHEAFKEERKLILKNIVEDDESLNVTYDLDYLTGQL